MALHPEVYEGPEALRKTESFMIPDLLVRSVHVLEGFTCPFLGYSE